MRGINEGQQHCRSPVATGTPSLQVIHMGVACRNAQLGTHEEEDDLEHTGLLTSLIVRANLHPEWSCAQALGTLRASSPRIYPVLFLQGADAETTSGPALGVMGGYRPLVWEN